MIELPIWATKPPIVPTMDSLKMARDFVFLAEAARKRKISAKLGDVKEKSISKLLSISKGDDRKIIGDPSHDRKEDSKEIPLKRRYSPSKGEFLELKSYSSTIHENSENNEISAYSSKENPSFWKKQSPDKTIISPIASYSYPLIEKSHMSIDLLNPHRCILLAPNEKIDTKSKKSIEVGDFIIAWNDVYKCSLLAIVISKQFEKETSTQASTDISKPHFKYSSDIPSPSISSEDLRHTQLLVQFPTAFNHVSVVPFDKIEILSARSKIVVDNDVLLKRYGSEVLRDDICGDSLKHNQSKILFNVIQCFYIAYAPPSCLLRQEKYSLISQVLSEIIDKDEREVKLSLLQMFEEAIVD
ncbi:hypothetical protein ADUPG1_002541 [Aduncisulcus paluster]|uniref:Uncharacterized protein n=1 Tax=Aduncisulcus paluster TaxID=2918883 RepID=A0ABQ5KRH7_9EUKA|nr:hypothetical protein ADUPG1_002541 [Aduncisulcus paluster]|eukprot:gnl/Carplike_NY0171/4452_a6044_291.p1 GENE.gnl/Carplike_NY0171/4452_a6044_291~~gnl/Carplike_NY0171/4452_a6044_291.p1  ORF type:complete len:365 (+),score=47.69 gnl/Carplike_NY0171/4452_a6044_291:26-1096(+)